jgi:hypothetical protein
MRKELSVSILIGLSLLAGCGAQTSTLGNAGKLEANEFGYVAATLVSRQLADEPGMLLPRPPRIAAEFYENTASPHKEFELHTAGAEQWKNPVSKEGPGGTYRAMLLVPVKPGRYWLGNVKASFFGGYQLDTELRAPYPTITVRKGEVTYAGSIQVISRLGRNVTGEVRPGGIFLNIGNDFEADIAAMKNMDPRVATLPVSNGLKK